MSDDDIKKARRMTFRLFSLGQKSGCSLAGELAQLLAGNVFLQNEKSSNLVNICLGGSDDKLTIAPLSKAVRLFMQARNEIPVPFLGRSDCLQSSIFDVLLCYISFWGQVFEYYETMYYKPVVLPNGDTDQSPANVSFEVGWLITCLFIRDMMLSVAAREAGVASGYDRSMSWYFYPTNTVEELDEAKAFVLTVIGRIRKRGTVLVAAEGILGHVSFSNSLPLSHWVDDKLDRDWNNVAKLEALANEYFESTSIRLNVSVVAVADSAGSESVPESVNSSFSGLETSFLDGLESDSSPSKYSQMSMTNRSISLNIRPITPILLGSASCDWSGIDMLEFCREAADVCQRPEVVNSVSTVGQIGISILKMTGEVVSMRRVPAVSRLLTPEKLSAILPFPTPAGMPNLEPFACTATPPILPIPHFTPTPRYGRDSEVTFFGESFSPAGHQLVSPVEAFAGAFGGGALVSLPADDQFGVSLSTSVLPVNSRPSVVASPQATQAVPADLASIIQALVVARGRIACNAKSWSLDRVLGELQGKSSVETLYMHLLSEGGDWQNQPQDNGQEEGKRKKRRKSNEEKPRLPALSATLLLQTETELVSLLKLAFSASLKPLSKPCRTWVGSLCRILSVASLMMNPHTHLSNSILASIVASAADFVCFLYGQAPAIRETDVFAAGLRGAYAHMHLAAIEVGKDLGLCDWLTLSLYYNDVAFSVLLGPNGVLQPSDTKGSFRSDQKKISHKLVRLSPWERLPQHCLLVGTELMMRWSWAPESRLWEVHHRLVQDFKRTRHQVHFPPSTSSEVDELNYFLKLLLQYCGLYLVDLADRLQLSDLIIHGAFDVLRAAILLRPNLLAGRHVYQLVYCSIVAAVEVLDPSKLAQADFHRLNQAAVVMLQSADEQVLVNKYVFKSVSLSGAEAQVVFADGSGPLSLPNLSGEPQPERELLGDIIGFHQLVFLPEMRQVLFNLAKVTMPKIPGHPKGDCGPFVDGMVKFHPSLSPFAFIVLSSSMGLAMQLTTGQSDLQIRNMPYEEFALAMKLVSPFGALPCLLPPKDPFKAGRPRERHFKWFADATVCVTEDGGYSVKQD